MAQKRRERIKALFEQALDLPADQRSSFLEEACGSDISLQQELISLLAFAEGGSEFFDDLAHGILSNSSITPANRSDLLIGQRIAQYEVLEQLGSGGMGVVYKARDTRLDRIAALKFLNNTLSANRLARERFVLEAKAASALDHPNISTIYEINETDSGQLYIAMACYEGDTLKQRLQQGPLPTEKAIDFSRQISKGLARAHEKGIVHRDIKPGNIIIVDDGGDERVKILDFGLAKISDLSLTRTGSTLGTVSYMSPEQAMGNSVDHRTDIWSLGVVLYEMLTGVQPFQGHVEHAVIYALIHEPPKPISEIRPDLPAYLEHFIRKALDKEPDKRFQSMDAVLIALNERNATYVQRETIDDTERDPKKASTLREIHRTFSKKVFVPVMLFFLLGVSTFLFFSNVNKGNSSNPSIRAQASAKRLTYNGNILYPSISPDGQLMAYYINQPGPNSKIVVREISGGQPLEVLSDIHTSSDYTNQIRWSFDGTKLYTSTMARDSSHKFYVVPRLGGDPRVFDFAPHYYVLSPDEKLLSTANQGSNKIELIDLSSMERSEIALQQNIVSVTGLDFSYTGNRYAISVLENNGMHALWIVSANGQQQERILELPDRTYSPRWASNNEDLYYTSFVFGGTTLSKVRVSPKTSQRMGDPILIHDNLHSTIDVSISRNTPRLVYDSNQFYTNLWQFDLIQADASPALWQTKLTQGTAYIKHPKISPDGSEIAFAMQGVEGMDIYTIPLEGGSIRRESYLDENIKGLAWRKGGKQIAFGYTDNKVWVLNRENGATNAIMNTATSTNSIIDIVWHPGEDIMYQSSREKRFNIINPKSYKERPLVANDSSTFSLYDPIYSPDGERVILGWFKSGNSGLWDISLTDGKRTQFYSFEQSGVLAPLVWSDDGQWIYALAVSEDPWQVVQIHVKTGKLKEVVSLVPGITYVDITPDGKYVVATILETTSDIYMLENFDLN